MKKFFKVIWKIISFPPLGIFSLILGLIILFGFDSFFGDFDQSYTNSLENVIELVFSEDGLMAGISNNKVLVVDCDYDTLNYKIEPKDINDDYEVNFKDVTFDENDNLYVFYTIEDDDSISITSEEIAMFDSEGNFKKTLVQYSYDEYNFYNNRNGNIYGINVHDDILSYIYVDVSLQNHLISIATNSSIGDDLVFSSDNYTNVVTDAVYTDKGFAVILSNGDIGYLHDDSFEYIANTDDVTYEIDGETYFIMPTKLYYSDGRLFCSGIFGDNCVYEITEKGFELFIDMMEEKNNFYSSDDYEPYNVIAFAAPVYSDLYIGCAYDGEVFYSSDEYGYLSGIYSNSLGHNIIYTLLTILDISSLIFILYGVVFCFGNFVGWKNSLLTKQLLVTIPLVAFSFLLLFSGFFIYENNRMLLDFQEQLTVFSKACATAFNGDELSQIAGRKDFVDSGLYRDYVQTLNNFVYDNNQSWSDKYTLAVMLVNCYREDNSMEFVQIASSDGYTTPNDMIYHMDWISDALLDKSVGSLFITSDPGDGDMYYTSDASIFDSNGNLVATVEVNTDMSEIDDQLVELLIISLLISTLLLIVLIVCISVLSKFNVRKLQKASEAVSNIAKGDFNSRIPKTGKDEVGQICMNVNDMASKLDVLFKEKDENEQFYYKFVPEQFKELLHKDKFTDLSLGDAESVDLTVLFCDIRSFSLNSEMMTAKENFEFINIIYGKAGPIIRKHNGFVDKYIGDAVMALFEKADDAIACGKELYNDIVLNPETAKELNVSSINIGIGIHTGMARIGIVGEEERMSGTVISNTVNLSSRLESLTKQYNTAMIISKDTLDKMENPDSLNLRYLGMIQVAGVNEVKALYEVLDCLDENRYVERFKTKAEFREAVRLYHLGELKKSLGMFKSIKDISKSDPCLDIYIEYIDKMIKEDNTDHNVFKFSRK